MGLPVASPLGAGTRVCRTAIRRAWPSAARPAAILRDSTWNLMSNVSIHLASVVCAVIAARRLGPQTFGKFAIINATIGLTGTIVALNIGVTATRHLAAWRDTDPVRARRLADLSLLVALLFGLLGTAAVAGLAAPVARAALHAPELASELRLASPLVLVSVLAGAQAGILAGLERFRTLATVNLLRSLVAVPATAVLIAFWGLPGAIFSLVAGTFAGVIAGAFAIHASMPSAFPTPDYLACWTEWRVLTSFSLPSLLQTLSYTPVQWTMAALLVATPGGFFEMGVYTAGSQVRTLVTYLPSALGQPALAMLSRQRQDGETFRRLYRQTLLLATGIAVLAGALVLCASPWILAVYHPEFRGHWASLSLLILSGMIQVPGWIASLALFSAGRMWTGFWLQGLWAAATLGSACWLVPRFGVLGLAAALLIGTGIQAPANLFVASRTS